MIECDGFGRTCDGADVRYVMISRVKVNGEIVNRANLCARCREQATMLRYEVRSLTPDESGVFQVAATG